MISLTGVVSLFCFSGGVSKVVVMAVMGGWLGGGTPPVNGPDDQR